MPGHLTNGANLLPLGTTGAGGILLTGNITGANDGPGTAARFGSGAITLSGANTQTGATTVNSGILRATTNATALGATTSALNLNGGVLQLANASGTNLTFKTTGVTTVSATSMITSDLTTGTVGNTYTLGPLTMNAGQNLIVTGGSNVASGTAGVTFGAVTLGGNATFTAVNPTTGTGTTLLTLGATSTGTNTLTFNGNGATKFGNNTLTVSGNSTIINNGFGATALAAPNLSIGAFTLTDAGASAVTLGGTATTLTGNAVFTNSGIGAETLGSGNISGAFTLGLNATSAGNLNVTGALQSNVLAVTVASGANSPGVVILSGNNQNAVSTTLTTGFLRATSSVNALGTGASTLLLNGGQLQLADNAGLTFARNTTVGGSTTILSDRTTANTGAATQTLGTLSLGAFTLTVGAGEFVTSGTAGLTFTTSATLTGAGTINTNNSFTSPAVTTTLTLPSLTGAQPAVIGGTGNTSITGGLGPITTVTKNLTGTLTLGGTSTNTGAVTINAGSVVVTQGGVLSTQALTFGVANSGTGTLNVNSGAAGTTQSLGALSSLGGSNTIQSTYGGAGTAVLNFSSMVARTVVGETRNFVTSGAGSSNGVNNSITITGSTVGLISGGAFFNGADFAYNNTAGGG